jgi:DNA-directed DNA polymerase III PolC
MYFNCHTHYSFRYGTLSPEYLLKEAQRCGVKKLILTEINNTASYIELLRLSADYDLEIALGMELRKENKLLYIALAENNTGFEAINRFFSFHTTENIPLPDRAPELENVFIIYPLSGAPELLRDDEWVGVRIHELTRFTNRPIHPDKLVAWHPVTFGAPKGHFNVHRLLRAIDTNTLLSKLPSHEQAHSEEVMMPEPELEAHYRNYPDMIRNTKRILEKCRIAFTLGSDKNKKTFTGSESNDWNLLVHQSWEGFISRYNSSDPVVRERFNRELEIIRHKNFTSYYLITHDIIQFAKRSGYDYVGRGSGANSMIAFSLGITNVDPIELDLYFERFLNPERSSPPDFDVDFSWKDRDAITRYIFDKHGKDHVCLLGTNTTFQSRSIIRELGKVFGLPKDELDSLVDYPDQYKSRDHITQLIFNYAECMHEMPSNISIHAGGVLITENPIYAYTATDLPPKGFPVSHFEMHSAEDMGLYKFDILSQRGLGHLKDTVHLVQKNRNESVDVNRFDAFKKDEKIKNLISRGKTMGCFYVESPAMRMLLEKLRCNDYLTLVAASSIIRPGVARSGMMRTYIERFHLTREGKKYESIHPKMDELMAETFGVMVYQEDVIKVAYHFAGLTLSEADILRRGMSGKFRSRKEFERVHQRFFENCQARNYPDAVANRVWYEIESFSGYSFSKGHSASYAVESYQSLYLKAHYPLEFMVGVINNFGGFYRTEFYFHEARMSGAIIEPPCINHSEHLTSIEGSTVYVGFIHLKSLETTIAQSIAPEREKNGPFRSLHHFLTRIRLGLEQVRILIRIGAFRFTGKTKQQLLWEAMLYFSERKAKQLPSSDHLFQTEPKEYPLPRLDRNPLEDAFDEMELLGFPLLDPFRLLQEHDPGDTLAGELLKKLGRRVKMVGYVVTTKDTRTIGGQPMHFGTFYDSCGDVFDTVHFPNIAIRYPFRGRGFYFLSGKVVEDFGVGMVEVDFMEKLPMTGPRGNMEEGMLVADRSPSRN